MEALLDDHHLETGADEVMGMPHTYAGIGVEMG